MGGVTEAALPARLAEYLALAGTHPAWFRNPPGGVEILLDPAAILAVEREMGARYAAQGLPASWAEVGIGYRDPYLMLLRDAVRFPGGDVGVHHRVLRGAGDSSGVAVLPRLPDGRVVLVRHFRHATRAWHWEVPRGGIEAGADPEETARTELAEEIGGIVAALTPLGAPALNEGITEIRPVTVGALEAMVCAGEITDAFTLAAFLNARLRGLL